MACLQLGRIREGSYRQLMVRSGVRVRIACATGDGPSTSTVVWEEMSTNENCFCDASRYAPYFGEEKVLAARATLPSCFQKMP